MTLRVYLENYKSFRSLARNRSLQTNQHPHCYQQTQQQTPKQPANHHSQTTQSINQNTKKEMYPTFQRTCHCSGTGQFPNLTHTPDCPSARLQSDSERPRSWKESWQEQSGYKHHLGPRIAAPHVYNYRDRAQMRNDGVTDTDRYRNWDMDLRARRVIRRGRIRRGPRGLIMGMGLVGCSRVGSGDLGKGVWRRSVKGS